MTTLIEAIRVNIDDMNDDSPGSPISPIKWTTTQKFGLSKVICMENRNITNVGNKEDIVNFGLFCEELDLGHNKIDSFEQVLILLDSLPNLKILNLSHNPLGSAESIDDRTSFISSELIASDRMHKTPFSSAKTKEYPNMETLVLNGTNINWPTIFDLLNIFPNLKTLHIALNNFGDRDCQMNQVLSADSSIWPIYPNLENFFYSHNGPIDWRENVSPLNLVFPNLGNLILLGCELEEIPEYRDVSHTFLKRLTSLNLQDTRIKCLESFDCLNEWLPMLKSLKVGTRLPVFNGSYVDDYRKEIISRMPNLQILNCAPISVIERERAERALLRNSYHLEASDRPKRFAELEAKHGHLDALADIDLSPNREVFIKVEYDGEEKYHSLKTDYTFNQAKEELGGLFGIFKQGNVTLRQVRLFYFDKEISFVQGPEELRSCSRMIYSLQPEEGDKFLLEVSKNRQRQHTSSSSS